MTYKMWLSVFCNRAGKSASFCVECEPHVHISRIKEARKVLRCDTCDKCIPKCPKLLRITRTG